MIWTILKADLLWIALTLPLTVGVQLWLAWRKRREFQALEKHRPAWIRGERTAERDFKIARMRHALWRRRSG